MGLNKLELGSVIGSIWATRKEEGLTGYKFLMVQSDSNEAVYVAVDRIGAGVGDKVLVTKGTPASFIGENLPIDALIIGIIDEK